MKFEEFEVGQVFVTDSKMITKEEALEYAQIYDPQRSYLYEDVPQVKISPFLVISIGWSLWIYKGFFENDLLGGVGMNNLQIYQPVFTETTIYTMVTVKQMRISRSRPQMGILTLHFQIKNNGNTTLISWDDISFMDRK